MKGDAVTAVQTPPAADAARWRLRERSLDLSAPRIMAICNVTPDSFSDGGEHDSVDGAVRFVEAAIGDGASIVDLGGESTRPGATPVAAELELARVMPVLEAVHARWPDLLISIDTVKAEVARAALAAGAHAINDVSGGRLDLAIFDVVARAGAGIVLLHSRGGVSDMASFTHASYGSDVTAEVCAELNTQARLALRAGVAHECIVLDPGIGFSKTSAHTLTVLRELHRVTGLGFPVMVGASRKRFIGELTGVTEPSRRVIGSAMAHVIAAQRGARLIRTHDVAATREALAVSAAI